MATPKSEKKKKKKKKSASVKKRTPDLKKKKKILKLKPPSKKVVKKSIKPKGKSKEPAKIPTAPLSEKESTRKLLLDMRDKLLAGTSENRLAESLATSSDIGDLIDQAGDERARELSLLLTGREKEKLMAINEALEKVAEGTYGICEECGEKIGSGRLKVMPLALLCVSCQAKLEKDISIQRKTEEDLTYRGLVYATGLEEEEP